MDFPFFENVLFEISAGVVADAIFIPTQLFWKLLPAMVTWLVTPEFSVMPFAQLLLILLLLMLSEGLLTAMAE